uniref:G_PROTEIN_RECEP_F3_4 domain-containing protein n=1 Tax=Globodera pallida TaxID=36090 RepID=A0A183CHZ5_GLOPA
MKFLLQLWFLAFCIQTERCSANTAAGDEQQSGEEQQKVEDGTANQQNKSAHCDVFDPFKVLPAETGHFQIGGAFSLHGQDCLKLIPSSVQDVVAIQWALAHWNEQGPSNKKEKHSEPNQFARPKLGLFAGDSCSRPKEAISQTLRFVDSVGYHEPSGCIPNGEEAKRISESPKLIGVIMPKDRESAESVAQVLRPSSVPIAAFSAASAQVLADANVRRFITTAPLFNDYAKTLIELLKMLGSDLISIVDYGEGYAYTPMLQEQLRVEGISTAEVVAIDHPMLPAILSASDSKIIVSLASHRIVRNARLGDRQISLPLAFVHAMSSFRRRHSPQSLLFNSGAANALDIGAVLVDTCANGRDLLEFLVDSERNCYKFSQAESNWTVPAGATIGYIVGAEHDVPQEGIIEAMFQKSETSPVIGIGTDQPTQNAQKGPLFTEGPNHRATAFALAQFLRRMHWQYVNVVLDRSSPSSVALFKQFDRIASPAGICTADLAIVGEPALNPRRRENVGGSNEGEEEMPSEKRKAKRGSTASKASAATEEEQRRRFSGVGPPSANVTLVFASAEQTADYMGTRLRDELVGGVTGIPTVHVMLGDAHNFHLHDPTNLAQFAGTLSFQGKDFTSPEFRDWLQTVTPLSLPEPWFWRYVEDTWHCSLFRNSFSRFNGRMCTGEERLDVKGMGQLTKAGKFGQGSRPLCTREKLCDEFIENGRKLTREFLRKSAKEDSADVFEVYEFMPIDHHGNFDYSLLANLSLPQSQADSPAGSNFPTNPTAANSPIHFLADYRPFAYGVPITRDSSSATEIRELGADAVDREVAWAIRVILLSLSALLSAIAIGTLACILFKIWRRTIRGSQSLGILLLLGIITMHLSAFLFTAENANEPFLCLLRIALPAMAHAICFGVILLELLAAVVLHSDCSDCDLFPMASARWILAIALLDGVTSLFGSSEAKWLFITSLICSLILTAWAALHTLLSVQHMEYLTVLELHLTGSILLAFVFGPKLYVLLFYEPVVVQYDSDGCLHGGGKALDLFEAADWMPDSMRERIARSPTLSAGSSNGEEVRNISSMMINSSSSRLHSGNSSVRGAQRRGGDEEEEKVTSAFQTILRKKISIGSSGAHKLHRTASESARNSAKDLFCVAPTQTRKNGQKILNGQ